jgi:plastocyanin
MLSACGGGSDTTAGPSTGGANGVTVGNNFYSPADLSVPANTTVTWTWADGASLHSVTFNDGGASSQQQTTGTFQRTFATPGTYTYFCTVHTAAVMHGTVTVTGPSSGGGGGMGGGGSGGGGYDY